MRLRLATEAIDFQRKDSFGKELEKIFKEIKDFVLDSSLGYDNVRIELQKADYAERLSALVLARLGIKVKFIFNTNRFASCLSFYLNKNHILLENIISDQFRIDEQEKILTISNNEKGWIDLKQAKVGGVFSKYEHRLYLNAAFMFMVRELNFNEKDATAIVLHELGHLFTNLEFSDRLERTNQVLASLANNLRTKSSKEQRSYLLKQLSKDLNDGELKNLENENNRLILGVTIFRRYVQFVKSQLPNDIYNHTSNEQLADNFTARFGYGKELILAMDKINTLVGEPEKIRAMRVFNAVGSFIVLFSTMGLSIASIFLGCFLAPLFTLLLLAVVLNYAGEANKEFEYDDIKIRYKRIRQQYIEMISQLQLSKAELKDVIDNVEVMDKIIKDTVVYRTLWDKIANVVFSKNRHAKADIELQQLIEDLTHNDLFLASAKLQTLELSQGA